MRISQFESARDGAGKTVSRRLARPTGTRASMRLDGYMVEKGALNYKERLAG